MIDKITLIIDNFIFFIASLNRANLKNLNIDTYKYILIFLFPIIIFCLLNYIVIFINILFFKIIDSYLIKMLFFISLRIFYLELILSLFIIIKYITNLLKIKSNYYINTIIFLILLIPITYSIFSNIIIFRELNNDKLNYNKINKQRRNLDTKNDLEFYKKIFIEKKKSKKSSRYDYNNYYDLLINIKDKQIKEIEEEINKIKISKKNNKKILFYYNNYSLNIIDIYAIINNFFGLNKDNSINENNFFNQILNNLLENKFFSLNELQNIFNNSYNKVKQDNNLKGIRSYIPYTLLSIFYTDNYIDSFKIILLFFIYIIFEIIVLISFIISIVIIKEFKYFSPIIYIEKYLRSISNNNNNLYIFYNIIFHILCNIFFPFFISFDLFIINKII